MPFQNIAIIGASGRLGPSVLQALIEAGCFKISALVRLSSSYQYPPEIAKVTVPEHASLEDYTRALQGQDALVVTLAGSKIDHQMLLADACGAAGVKRMVPADFGSCDSADPDTMALLKLFKGKANLRRHLEDLARKEGSSFSWTAFVCGHFFDYGLKGGLLQTNVENRQMTVLDGGDIMFSATTLETIGLAVTRSLQREEKTKNRLLYIQSFCVTQNEVLAALKRATPGSEWHIERADSKERISESRIKAEEGDPEAIEQIVSIYGIVASNWEGKDGFANQMLSLEAEDLDEVVKCVVRSLR